MFDISNIIHSLYINMMPLFTFNSSQTFVKFVNETRIHSFLYTFLHLFSPTLPSHPFCPFLLHLIPTGLLYRSSPPPHVLIPSSCHREQSTSGLTKLTYFWVVEARACVRAGKRRAAIRTPLTYPDCNGGSTHSSSARRWSAVWSRSKMRETLCVCECTYTVRVIACTCLYMCVCMFICFCDVRVCMRAKPEVWKE